MTFAPRTLLELGRYYTAAGGAFLGIVGDARHTVGYHLGRDRIYDGSGPGRGDLDYSVKLRRDAAGLTDAASAIDFGRIGGSLPALYAFSSWMVDRCMEGAPGSRDVREIIYSPDGERVQRYSGVDGIIHTGEGNGDASHLTHTHVSYFRDAEHRDKIELIRPYFEGNDMAAIVWYPIAEAGDGEITLKDGRGLVDLITGRRYVPADRIKGSVARVSAVDVGNGFLVRDQGHGCLALDDAVAQFRPRDPLEPDLKRYVITVDAAEMTITEDGVPIE